MIQPLCRFSSFFINIYYTQKYADSVYINAYAYKPRFYYNKQHIYTNIQSKNTYIVCYRIAIRTKSSCTLVTPPLAIISHVYSHKSHHNNTYLFLLVCFCFPRLFPSYHHLKFCQPNFYCFGILCYYYELRYQWG